MYKIITDIKQLEAINNAVKERENNPDSQYCEVNKHVSQELYAIPIMADYLKELKLPFITDEWLNTDIVEQIPQDWTWYFDTAIRIIIPNYLILKEPYLKALIPYCDANAVLNITPENGESSYIYVSYILPEHQALFDMYPQIKIEIK